MRLQIVSNLFPLPWEPNRAAFNRQQFEALSRKCEVRVLVVVSWLDRIRNQVFIPSIKFQGIMVDYLWFFYIPKILRFTYPASLLLTLIFKIPKLLRYRPDCLLLSWAFPDAVAGIVISRILKIPSIIKIHGSDINSHTLYPSRKKQILWAMSKADAVISVSKALSVKLSAMGVSSDKIHVIYNGVNQELFRPADKFEMRQVLNIQPERKLVLFIGNLKVTKGCVDLLDAFNEIATESENVDLYYIGSGDSAASIRQEITNEHLGDRVHLLGNLAHSQIVTWLNASDVLVLPSYNEGVPNVLLEAMACGIPVVATRVGGIPEIVNEETGILVDLGDLAGLAKAIKDSIFQSWNKEVIIDSVKKHTWENNAEQIVHLAESISMGS